MKTLKNMYYADFLFILTLAHILMTCTLLFAVLQNIDGKSSRRKNSARNLLKKIYRQVDTINLAAIKPKQNKTGRKKKRRPVNNLDKR